MDPYSVFLTYDTSDLSFHLHSSEAKKIMGSVIRTTWLQRALATFSLCFFSFSLGIAVTQFRIYPYPVLRDASTALQALTVVAQPRSIDGLATYQTQTQVPLAISHSEELDETYVLVSAGAAAFKSNFPEGVMAWIVDRKGDVVHHWKSQPGLWDNLEKVTRVPGVSGAISPASLHLCENGDLIATYHGHNTFPFGVGIARFDCHSNLIWKKELLTHHSFSVAEDGRIFVPAVEVVDSPIQIAHTESMIYSDSGKILRDLILVLAPNGDVLEQISVLDALFDSGLHGNLLRANASMLTSDDPTHLNDVQLISEADTAHLPGAAPGDLLVSMRNINAVGLLDPHSRRFKWFSSGTMMGQHSPRVYQHGVVAIDNLGGDRRLGGTQLTHIDFATGLPKTLFPRVGIPMPDLCRTVNSGHLDVHRNRNLALFSVSHEGTIWEIDLETGKVEWEYIYAQPEVEGGRQMIGPTKYVYDLSFLGS